MSRFHFDDVYMLEPPEKSALTRWLDTATDGLCEAWAVAVGLGLFGLFITSIGMIGDRWSRRIDRLLGRKSQLNRQVVL